LESLGLWCNNKEQQLIDSTRKEILSAFSEAEKKSKPHWKELFTDVYKDMPGHIKYIDIQIITNKICSVLHIIIFNFICFRKQMNLMEKHLEEFKEHYPLSSFMQTK